MFTENIDLTRAERNGQTNGIVSFVWKEKQLTKVFIIFIITCM